MLLVDGYADIIMLRLMDCGKETYLTLGVAGCNRVIPERGVCAREALFNHNI